MTTRRINQQTNMAVLAVIPFRRPFDAAFWIMTGLGIAGLDL